MNYWTQGSEIMGLRDSKMLARLWLELLTVGSKLGEKMEAKRHWGGEGAWWDSKFHRTAITRVRNVRTGDRK